jgi:hypothetical protein
MSQASFRDAAKKVRKTLTDVGQGQRQLHKAKTL